MFFWNHSTHHSKRHLNPVSRFPRIYGRYQRTDGQNDDRTRPVAQAATIERECPRTNRPNDIRPISDVL